LSLPSCSGFAQTASVWRHDLWDLQQVATILKELGIPAAISAVLLALVKAVSDALQRRSKQSLIDWWRSPQQWNRSKVTIERFEHFMSCNNCWYSSPALLFRN